MYDPEATLDAQIFALFVRQHELRIRLPQAVPQVDADWEALHQQLDLLNDHRICLAQQVEEVGVEEWISMSDLAIAISKGCDQLEASLEAFKPARNFPRRPRYDILNRQMQCQT